MSSVLVVEDSADQADLLRQNFERSGCSVTVVSTGEDALGACAIEVPEIIVIDLVLPGMHGSQLAALVRENYPSSAIVISSVLDAADFPHSDAVLPKPFNGSQVRHVLSTLELARVAQ